jgi:hypothetical protein
VDPGSLFFGDSSLSYLHKVRDRAAEEVSWRVRGRRLPGGRTVPSVVRLAALASQRRPKRPPLGDRSGFGLLRRKARGGAIHNFDQPGPLLSGGVITIPPNVTARRKSLSNNKLVSPRFPQKTGFRATVGKPV